MAVRHEPAPVARLLIFRRRALRDAHMSHAVAHFYIDELTAPTADDKRVLLGLPDGSVITQNGRHEKVFAGHHPFRRGLPLRRRAKRLVRADVVDTMVVPGVGTVGLVSYDPAFGM